MLKEIRADLVEFLGDIPGISKADIYKGEFEEDGEWVPVIPCAFVNFTIVRPSVGNADLTIARNRYGADIYIADRTDAAQITETVIDELSITDITINDNCFRIKITEVSLLGYIKNIEVWKIKIEVI